MTAYYIHQRDDYQHYVFHSCPLALRLLVVTFSWVLHLFIPEFVVHRAEKFGGTVRFTTYKELAEAYAKEEVYPLDLKNAVAAELNKVSYSLVLRPL